MSIKKDGSITYMGHLQSAWYASDVTDAHEIDELLNQFRRVGHVMHHSMPLFFVIDYTAQQYIVMTDAMQLMAGYHPREFMETKMEKLLEVYHKDDFTIYNKNIFTANTAFLKSTPQHLHRDYVFAYNFRFMRSDKKMAQVIQRGTYITSPVTGLPLYSVGMLIDITDFKTDNVMVHTIERNIMDNDACSSHLVQRNYFYPDQYDAAFTRREIEVLPYIADGLSSKQIAGKLNISESTVINHKQNMMRKSNTKNTTELVVMAVRNRII